MDKHTEQTTSVGDGIMLRGGVVIDGSGAPRYAADVHVSDGRIAEIGPSLATIRHRAPEEVLLHILDPNREVGPNFVAYAVETNDGRVLTGLIVEDTASSITLIRTTGTRESILRSNIEEIAATGQSLMPPGLEDRITPQEMADLLAFLLPK